MEKKRAARSDVTRKGSNAMLPASWPNSRSVWSRSQVCKPCKQMGAPSRHLE
ncbi:hypothetical protein PAXRUDRAFT_821918 [Paxillus rubicundulus Ve08.2h10]|uniref:Uncharacterized protein n=1 Tax=Paxillus rubicundulus Ve08.2h10 TaxID=930991 RepID=A0A0D0DMZ8_9AGAM|nr:hypothetical protein PAXRUDRAFT_821918 [Paxillus rubicundulus Ve08.2h10]